MSREFEISKLLEITDQDKYAAAVAAFEIIDLLEQVDVPRKLRVRKPSIQAMYSLADKVVQYDFISDEDRENLYEELHGPRDRDRDAEAREVLGEAAEAQPEAAAQTSSADQIFGDAAPAAQADESETAEAQTADDAVDAAEESDED